MIKLWQWFWYGHTHKWVEDIKGDLTYNGKDCGRFFVYKCSECGKVKTEKT